ncbi:MAG: GNAT family N-acetyltransferase [Clostridiales bacterium]|nr:GNAT family N-acetyltransferase [Clostridiales bacterium]
MKTLEILGGNRFETYTRTRVGCRGIVMQGDQILLSREENVDYWLIPGGGLEKGESLAACCEREIREETGCVVRARQPFLMLREFYEECCYTSFYFLCEAMGRGERNLTEEEQRRGLVPRWLPFQDAVEIFSRHAEYAAQNEEKRGAYLREYLALQAFAARPQQEREPLYIEGERLLITEFSSEMSPDVHRNSLDEDNRRFVPDEVFETEEEAREALAFLMSRYEGNAGPFVYPVLLKTGENIGYVQAAPIGNGWEAGYHIAKPYTGRGYAAEAVSAFLPVIARQLDIDRVEGVCLKENAASVRVLEKCGFRRLYAGPGRYQGEERAIVKTVWTAPEN